MANFYGKLGFVSIVQSAPGVMIEDEIQRNYYGELLKLRSNVQNSGNVNDNPIINHSLSIMGDEYAFAHYMDLRFVVLQNKKWRISSIEMMPPRINITLGGLYNE